MDQLHEGSLFAGHRIEGLIGRGGMGVVYRATHLALDRSVALKLITPDLADEPGFRERFQRESKIAAALDHPHVITVHHAGEEQGLLFITMRLIDGEDLGAVIKREGSIAPERAARITGQVAEALDAAHAARLVHRDVKPANVLVAGTGENERVYLTDFGLTKRDASAVSLTRTGEIVGTLDYIAPEQIRGEAVDARTDVYALGCMLFHMVTGRVPFPADIHAAKVFAHLSDEPPRVTEYVPDAPAALDGVVRRAMAKDPDERFQAAGELGAAALAAVRPAEAPDHERPAAPERKRRIPPPALVVAGLAVVAAVVAGLIAGGGSDSGSGGGRIDPDAVRAALDSYQASLTNGDSARLEGILAPNFTRQLLAGPQVNRATALSQYREGFQFRGQTRRYSLSDVQVLTGDGTATATAQYSFTGTPEPHLGDYGAVRFQFVQRGGKVQIEHVESYPDVIAFLPREIGPSDYPITVRLTATTRAGGRTVQIAGARTKVPRPPDAVKVPLNAAGHTMLKPNQPFRARTSVTLRDGRTLPTETYVSHFEASERRR